MRLGKYLSGLTRSELEKLEVELNLTDDERIIFRELSKGKSNEVVADLNGFAYSTVSKRIAAITSKLNRIGGDGF